VSYAEAEKQAQADPSKVWFTYWGRKGCPPCVRMELNTLTDPAVLEALDGCVCVRLDMDAEPAKCRALGLDGSPAVTIAVGTKVVARVTGHMGPGELLKLIADVKPKPAAPTAEPPARFPLVRRMLGRLSPAVEVRNGPVSGSGTCVHSAAGKSLILTNRHVVADRPSGWVVAGADRWSEGTVKAVSPDADLALIECPGSFPVAPLAESDPAGLPVRRLGFGRGVLRVAAGRLGELVRGKDRVTTMESIPGDSGSGVLDPDGRLVAVTWGQFGDPVPQGQTPGPCKHNGCVPRAAVRSFLAPHLTPTPE
jgi:S1-C subfamily serine protease